jgi:nicotinamide-nucleotide amidase
VSPHPTAVAVHRLLVERAETLAVAESLTGGLLAATLVDVPGVSATFRGGLVVYATDLKAGLAGVPADLLAARGPVDPDVAAAMAAGALAACRSDWGLATTGVAGPDPQDGVPVGTVFLAVAGPPPEPPEGPATPAGAPAGPPAGPPGPGAPSRVVRLALSGDRATVRRAAVLAALGLLADALRARERES